MFKSNYKRFFKSGIVLVWAVLSCGMLLSQNALADNSGAILNGDAIGNAALDGAFNSQLNNSVTLGDSVTQSLVGSPQSATLSSNVQAISSGVQTSDALTRATTQDGSTTSGVSNSLSASANNMSMTSAVIGNNSSVSMTVTH